MCTAEAKAVAEGWKTGVHMHWPQLVVSPQQMEAIRAALGDNLLPTLPLGSTVNACTLRQDATCTYSYNVFATMPHAERAPSATDPHHNAA